MAGFFYELGTPEYNALMPPGKRIPGTRAIIGLDVYKVGTVGQILAFAYSWLYTLGY
jgi:hypothetical protein